MTKLSSRIGVCLVIGICLLALAPASGQTVFMRVNVPFAFLAGNSTHPAGDYWVRVDESFRILDLRPVKSVYSERLQLKAAVVERKGEVENEGFLRFKRYGASYVLGGIWAQGASGAGYELPTSRAEVELAKGTNANAPVVSDLALYK